MRQITTHTAPASSLRGLSDTSWQPQGACHGMNPEDADATFFALPRDHAATEFAKELCARCPVRTECLNYALENGIRDGVWGGLTTVERLARLRRLPDRLDYGRVAAFFDGRDVHLTQAERDVVIDHAYARGWRRDRLATALRISPEHARDLLRKAANKISDRDRTSGVPRRKPTTNQTQTAKTGKPAASRLTTQQPVSRPVTSASAHAPLGKAA
ncbi:WhiB family transcriptional regulator [Streptomyces sp. CAS3]